MQPRFHELAWICCDMLQGDATVIRVAPISHVALLGSAQVFVESISNRRLYTCNLLNDVGGRLSVSPVFRVVAIGNHVRGLFSRSVELTDYIVNLLHNRRQRAGDPPLIAERTSASAAV